VFGADIVLAVGHRPDALPHENPGKLWTIMLNERLSGEGARYFVRIKAAF
jgi:hypothetical protein